MQDLTISLLVLVFREDSVELVFEFGYNFLIYGHSLLTLLQFSHFRSDPAFEPREFGLIILH